MKVKVFVTQGMSVLQAKCHLANNESESESHSILSDSSRPHGLYSPWNFPGQNTGLGSCSLLQGIFPTQGSNPALSHCRRILYQLSHMGLTMVSAFCVCFVRQLALIFKVNNCCVNNMWWGGGECVYMYI